ncbi:putative FAD binding domain-containing protein [Rosellinia necatrix]|uniref:Putative FAD binding domain-containing protein n=1 Tax=Rosellinia necatrix TaxID=77044 RepID=A0A1S7UIN1_ROSNE|nr:putative FAD binding domain-containing protein [Rosellinia necatrix]
MARLKPEARITRSGKSSKLTELPKTTRPYNALYVLIFAVASALAAWLMRIETGIKGIPVDFVENVEARVYPNGMPMRTRYTGIEAVDSGLLFLVAAFIAGPLGWDEGVRLHQLHFLVQFFAVIAVWNVEACRMRHSWKLISFTGLFVLFYQTIAGAAIIPLYYLSYMLISKSDAYYVTGAHVSMQHARGLLVSVALGYLLPTLAMYAPGLSAETTQFLVFLWQPSPGFVNVLLFAATHVLSPGSRADASGAGGDVKHLKRIYAAAAAVCGINHLVTLYVCATSADPQLGFAYVFLPDRAAWMRDTTAGLHYIFQVDWWGCFLPTLLWAWVAVYDVHRILLGRAGAAQLTKWAVYIVGLTLALGPGGMLAVVWSWREDRLVMIESGERGTLEKPKTE